MADRRQSKMYHKRLYFFITCVFVLISRHIAVAQMSTPLAAYPRLSTNPHMTGPQLRQEIDSRLARLWDYVSRVGGEPNQIRVTNPPYSAKGDGISDDLVAIQAAIGAACAVAGHKPEVYLPATPGSACYRISAPIRVNCSLRFRGAGWTQSAICPTYLGPSILVQAAETDWKPPLTSSVTVAWQASHTYSPYRDILDSNGNLEVQTVYNSGTGCTSDGGKHPTWPTVPGHTVADGTCAWTLATIGTQIAPGTGSSLDAANPEMFPGAGYGNNNASIEIGNPGNLERSLNGLRHFTVEFYIEPFASDAGAFANFHLIDIAAGSPEASNISALSLGTNGQTSGCAYNCLYASTNIGGSKVVINGSGVTDSLTINRIHHVALTYDGSTLRLFIDGKQIGSAAASGNWTIPPYESIVVASYGPAVYPNGHPTTPVLAAFYDSIRFSKIARYTSNFAKPRAKFEPDTNTLFLMNFPTNSPAGTIQAVWGNKTKNVFIPIPTSNGAAEVNPGYVGDLSVGDNGIWADWMVNSTIENIAIPDAGRTCVTLADNAYQDTLRHIECGVVPGARTTVGFVFGKQSNNNLYDHLQCDGQYTCIEQYSGSGTYILPDLTSRGYDIYPFVFIEAQALLDSPTTDIEASAVNFRGDIYSESAYAPIVIRSGQLTSGAKSGAYLVIKGGQPLVVNGTLFSGDVAEAVNVLATPASPVTISDSTIVPRGRLVNLGKERQVWRRTGGTMSWFETSNATHSP
jgi:hypothetical protein